MDITKFLSKLSIFIILLLIFPTIAYPRSVYVITDHEDSDISAYEITGDQISYQIQMDPPLHFGFGAVGLALDPDSEILFVTYERSNIIEMLNAKTIFLDFIGYFWYNVFTKT